MLSAFHLLGLAVAEESDPVGTAEDDPLDEHVLEGERLEVAGADLRATFVAYKRESDLAPIVLNVHLGEAMMLLSGSCWGICSIRHVPAMDNGLESYCVTRWLGYNWTATVMAAT